MLDRDAAWLLEIETAIADIHEYTAGHDGAAFVANRMRYSAVAMQMIVIGEASGKLSEAAKAEAPHIPWPKVISLRNRIAHGYRTVDPLVLWEIVHNSLPELRVAVRRMLAARGE